MDVSVAHPALHPRLHTESSSQDASISKLISEPKVVAGLPVICFTALALATLMNTVDINAVYETGEDHLGLDWPVVIKLIIAAVCGLVGGFGLFFSRDVRRSLSTLPGSLLTLLAVVFVVTSAFAYEEVATISRAAAVINFGYLLFVPTALASLGLRRFMIACVIGLTINLMINWGLYLLLPTVGVFEEDLGDHTLVNRMGGLGHPNAIARTAVLAGLLSMAMLRSRGVGLARSQSQRPLTRIVLMSILVVALITMVSAFSRTGLVAGVAAATLLMIDRLMTRSGLLIAILLLMTLSGGVIIGELSSGKFFKKDTIASVATKTGDVEELTSATGRTVIWGRAIELIAERPLVGWGLNSAPKLFQEFSFHTHNLLLHATFSGGVIAGFLVLLILAWNLFVGTSSVIPLIRAVSAYVIVSGLFEDTVLDTFASPSSLLWFAILAYSSIIQNETTHSDQDFATSGKAMVS